MTAPPPRRDPRRRCRRLLAPDGRGRGGDGAAYAHAGKMDEAKAALVEAPRANPEITIKWMKEHTPNLPAVFDGLRKAGLPEE